MKRTAILLATAIILTACSAGSFPGNPTDNTGNKNQQAYLVNEKGKTVRERIKAPAGFERVDAPEGSFGEYLRSFPLKPHGTKVKYYNGVVKFPDVHEAVLDMDVGNRDLQQCADAVIRLRAEYLYGTGQFDKIHFNFTNGFNADYVKWSQGNRIAVRGNEVHWVKETGPSRDYKSFRKYLDMVFTYAGTDSLSREMKKVQLENMKIGDVFIQGGNPGHCAIVLDMAENRATGKKIFILAQSYMPAQDIHILKNPANRQGTPWYPADFKGNLITPQWKFTKGQLARFAQ